MDLVTPIDIPEGGWNLFGLKEKPKMTQNENIKDVYRAILGDHDKWKQYCNVDIYEFDKAMREWLQIMSTNTVWCRSYKKRRYTFKMIYEQIFQKEYVPKEASKYLMIGARICAYYSSKVTRNGSINGKNYSKSIYCISPSRLHNLPYSLRLRIEEFEKEGIVPTNSNTKLPEDNLEPGHARNPKTEENMRKRSEEAKRRYYERTHGNNSDQ